MQRKLEFDLKRNGGFSALHSKNPMYMETTERKEKHLFDFKGIGLANVYQLKGMATARSFNVSKVREQIAEMACP